MNKNSFDTLETDVIIIGSGIAGTLTTNLLAKNGLNVIIATDGNLCGGASFFNLKATLGIQTSDNTDKDKESYKEDIYRTGGGIVNKDITEIFVNESFQSEEILREIGFNPRIRNDKRRACFANHLRPIYLIEDWDKARKKVKEKFDNHKNISILENAKAVKILKNNNMCLGALFIKDNKYINIYSRNVVIASGGIASIYKNNLYPISVDGSGYVLAKEAGAYVKNIEFIQFIPGILKPRYKTLFGEHTLKYVTNVLDDKGNDIFSDYSKNEKEDLFKKRSQYAPFSYDFKCREFDFRIAKTVLNGSNGVKLEYSSNMYNDNEDFLVTYLAWLKDYIGIDLRKDIITIDHFAHSCNGGIAIDIDCNTSLEGLYAVGEVANTVEGSNRLGGNSIASICVFTKRLVKNILSKNNRSKISKYEKNNMISFLEESFNSMKLSDGTSKYQPSEIIEKVKNIATRYALVVRSEKALKKAISIIDNLEKKFSLFEKENKLSYSAYFALKSSKLLFEEAYKRKESSGAHYIEK